MWELTTRALRSCGVAAAVCMVMAGCASDGPGDGGTAPRPERPASRSGDARPFAIQLGRGLFAALRPNSNAPVAWMWRPDPDNQVEYWSFYKLGMTGGHPIIAGPGGLELVYEYQREEPGDVNGNGTANELADFDAWVKQGRLYHYPASKDGDITKVHYGDAGNASGTAVRQFESGVHILKQGTMDTAFVWRPDNNVNHEIWVLMYDYLKPSSAAIEVHSTYRDCEHDAPTYSESTAGDDFVAWLYLKGHLQVGDIFEGPYDHGLKKR